MPNTKNRHFMMKFLHHIINILLNGRQIILNTDLCDVCFNASHLYIANIVKKTLPTNSNFDYNCLISRE